MADLNFLLGSVGLALSTATLVYDMHRDGPTAAAWHGRVDGKPCMLTLMRVGDDAWFGGYTEVGFGGSEGWKRDTDAFLFTIRNPHGTPPTIYRVGVGWEDCAVFQRPSGGPHFGNDLAIAAPFDTNLQSSTFFPYHYSYTVCSAYNTFHNAGVVDEDGRGYCYRGQWAVTGMYSFCMKK